MHPGAGALAWVLLKIFTKRSLGVYSASACLSWMTWMVTSELPPGGSSLTSKYWGCVSPALCLWSTESFILEWKTWIFTRQPAMHTCWERFSPSALLTWIMQSQIQGFAIRFVSFCQFRRSSLRKETLLYSTSYTQNLP